LVVALSSAPDLIARTSKHANMDPVGVTDAGIMRVNLEPLFRDAERKGRRVSLSHRRIN